MPVHFARKGVAVQGMAHHLFRVLDQVIVRIFPKIIHREEVFGRLPCAEMVHDCFRAACFIPGVQLLFCVRQIGNVEIRQVDERIHPVHQAFSSVYYFRNALVKPPARLSAAFPSIWNTGAAEKPPLLGQSIS